MITVTFYKDSPYYYKGFQFKGHAGYASAGKDIVCSAVSALVISTENAIDMLTDVEYDIQEDDGFVRLMLHDSRDHDSQLLVKALVLGIQGIYDSYGKKYLQLHFKEV